MTLISDYEVKAVRLHTLSFGCHGGVSTQSEDGQFVSQGWGRIGRFSGCNVTALNSLRLHHPHAELSHEPQQMRLLQHAISLDTLCINAQAENYDVTISHTYATQFLSHIL